MTCAPIVTGPRLDHTSRAAARLLLPYRGMNNTSRKQWEGAAFADGFGEAGRIAHNLETNVAIIDYSLPLLNGAEVTRQIN
jgi:hypothetical protein